MRQRLTPFIIFLLVLATTITGIVGIGELLLFVGTIAAVPTALALTVLVGLIGAALSYRAAKLPPVRMPGPVQQEPVRQLDLGAGYLVGQFVLIFGAMLLLLFVVLALRR